MNQKSGEAVMKDEITDAVSSLAHLFLDVKGKLSCLEDSIIVLSRMPEEYDPDDNLFMVLEEGTTPYKLGRLAGEFLYFHTNPEIRRQRDKYQRIATCASCARAMGEEKVISDKEHTQAYAMSDAYSNLHEVITHYCGLTYAEKNPEQENDRSEKFEGNVASEPDDEVREYMKASLMNYINGMRIAEELHERFNPKAFASLTSLSLEQAVEHIKNLTGLELVEGIF